MRLVVTKRYLTKVDPIARVRADIAPGLLLKVLLAKNFRLAGLESLCPKALIQGSLNKIMSRGVITVAVVRLHVRAASKILTNSYLGPCISLLSR